MGCDVALDVVKEVKYLGVTFDSELKMSKHIEQTLARAKRGFWAASALGSRSWGATPQIFKFIYTQIILPRILYGCITYWHRIKREAGNSARIKPFEQIQRMASLMISGAMRLTPNISLNLILNLPPIELLLTRMAMECFSRLSKCNAWISDPFNTRHAAIEKLVMNLSINLKTDVIPEIWFYNKRFQINSEPSYHELINSNGSINIFADASKMNSRVGIGIHSGELDCERSLRISDGTNINIAEVISINKASDICETFCDSKINIWTDSKEALKLLGSGSIISSTVLKCIKSLNRVASKNHSLEVCWLPKKFNIHEHTRADSLAKAATGSLIIHVEVARGEAEAQSSLDRWMLREISNDWEKVEIKTTKLMLSGPDDERLLCAMKLDKKDLRTVVAMITGHAPLKSLLFHMKKVTNDRCRYCGNVRETMKHIITSCGDTGIITARRQYLKSDFLDEVQLKTLSLSQLLKFAKGSGLYEVLHRYPP